MVSSIPDAHTGHTQRASFMLQLLQNLSFPFVFLFCHGEYVNGNRICSTPLARKTLCVMPKRTALKNEKS
jgi:hypothetical protein